MLLENPSAERNPFIGKYRPADIPTGLPVDLQAEAGEKNFEIFLLP
jgi:hypothetical protein